MADFRETETPACRGPYCGHRFDRATSAMPDDRDAVPVPGAASVCISCASVLVFDDALRLRKPYPGEIEAAFAEDPVFARNISRAQRLVRSMDRREMPNA